MNTAFLQYRFRFLLLTLLLISFVELKSQQLITIGTGSTLESIPVQGNEKYGWTAVVYPSWDMSGAIGSITKMAFDVGVVQDNPSVFLQNQKIYLKEVSYSNFTNTSYLNPTTIGATLVYDGSIQWNSLGWKTINFDQDFDYNGGNLLVLYENRGNNTSDFYSLKFKTTNLTAPNRCKKKSYWFNLPTGNGYYDSKIPNVQFTVIPVVPNNIAANAWVIPQGDIAASPNSTVKVRIKNRGTVSQDTIAIKYSVDNGSTYYFDTIFSSISPSDTFTHTFVPTADLSKFGRYDCSFIVKNQGDTIVVDDTLFYNSLWVGGPLSGTYTIGSNPQNDFSELTDAVNTLYHFGMSSSVVFELDSGVYAGNIDLNASISGLSAANTLIIKGQGANSIVSASNSGSNNWILYIDNNSNITIDSVSFYSSSNAYSGLAILNSDNVSIKNCFIELPILSTSSTNSVRVSGSNSFVFSNNKVIGGKNALNITGSTYNSSLDLSVINNRIVDFRDNGIVSVNQTNAAYDNNYVNSKSDISASNCIKLTNNIGVISVRNNVIINNGNAGMAMHLSDCVGDSTNPVLINNNMISCPISTINSFLYGIYVTNGSYMYINSNSVYIGSSAGIYSRCVYAIYSSSVNHVSNQLRNNILSNFGDGYAIRIFDNSHSDYFTDIDYNNVYTKGSKYVKYGYNDYYTLASWQANTFGYAANSISTDPVFYSEIDLHSRSILMNDSGVYIPNITTDIDGDMRYFWNPDIGADEYTPLNNDMVMLEWSSPLNGNPLSSSVPIEVLISNYGVQTQSNIPVKYSIDGGINYIVDTIAGPLNSYDSVTFTFSTTADMSSFGIHYCKAIIDLPTDQYRANDTISYKMFSCDPMNGAYTMGNNISSDFASFDDLNYAINSCGVSGPVVIYLDSGIYNQSIVFNEITGTSSTNTITIKGMGAGKTLLTNSNTNTNNRSVIKFDGAKYFIIDSLSIIRDSTVDYFWGIHFIHQANNNKISNCNIECGDGSSDNIIGIIATSSNNSAIAHGRNTSNTIIENNRIIGGKYGINLLGYLSYKDLNNIIRNNDIEDQYYCSISTVYQEGLNIDGNRILGGPQSSKYAVGIRSARSTNKCIIEKNSIYLEGQYGICTDEYSHTNGSPDYLTVKNNFVNIFNNTVNLPPNPNFDDRICGIYSYGSSYCRYYNNTVRVGGSSTNTGAAMYFYGMARANVKNNIFINEIGGAALDLFNNSTITYFYNDNNNLIASSGIYASADGYGYTNLANWKFYSSASNTVSIDPEFIGNNNFHANSIAMSNLGVSISDVTEDIDGEPRSTSPDIGADEYVHQSLSIGGPYMFCDGDSVIITSNIGSSYTYLWTFNGDTLLNNGSSVVIDTTGVLTIEILGSSSSLDTTNIELIPYPAVNLGSDTIVKMITGGLILDVGNPDATVLWSTGDTTHSKSFSSANLQLGDNEISVDVSRYTCSTQDTIILTLIDDTSIDNIIDNNEVILSPNPNKGIFNLAIENVYGDVDISIIDISGKIVFSKKYNSNGVFEETIDISKFSKGIFVLKIENDGSTNLQKLIVN